MKVCPECHTSYPDDVEECPDDGADLIVGAEELPDNPELQEVIQVAPDEATSMVDLEALEREFRERQQRKAEEELARARAAEERRAEEAEEEAERARRDDPEATGTAFRVRPQANEPSTGDGEAVDDDDPKLTRPKTKTKVAREKTQVEARTPSAKPAKKGGARKFVALLLVFAVIVVGGGSVVGWFFFGPGRGRLLLVQTVPSGAKVFVDGKLLGLAPTQTRIRPGTHQIELTLGGYETFKEVFKVEPTGDDVRFVQPLKSLAPENHLDEAAKIKEEADRLARLARELIDAKKFDEALDVIKQFIKLVPDDPRGDELFDALARAKVAQASAIEIKSKPVVLTAAQKRKLAREKYSDGERQYRLGQFDEATETFREAIRLDSRYAAPHRAIARVFNRTKDLDKARYHLSRYLQLGGRDPDRTVKRWLDEHPK